MIEIIDKYLKENNKEFQRYNSWNHCYKAFGDLSKSNDELALHLGFYLASWGMYRDSSQLLQKDYTVHLQMVEVIRAFQDLRCTTKFEVSINDLDRIIALIQATKEVYGSIGVTATNTLVTKIILGTLGCLPAYDRFFIAGLKQCKEPFTTLSKTSLTKLLGYVEQHKQELESIKREKKLQGYPLMKLVDMYFWQIGYEKSNIKKD
ncbi:hypothetical protein [Leeuwenhoekiella sp. CH_XMU1409-2]|uniref:hypothetical protein n=1 Tax=Leeuwenhoekiella sp. CH_XMU1409-2 TaxID=3107768 RepID=UPI0030087B93